MPNHSFHVQLRTVIWRSLIIFASKVQNHMAMPEVIEKPTLNISALKKIAEDDPSAFLRSDVEDAVANLAQLLEKRHMEHLRFAAQTLLTVHTFELPTVLPLEDKLLEPVLRQVTVIQDALQKQFEVFRKSAQFSFNPAIREAEEIVLESIEKSFDYIEFMRWQLMNAQAETDIKNGQVKSFGSVDAALKFLDRLG